MAANDRRVGVDFGPAWNANPSSFASTSSIASRPLTRKTATTRVAGATPTSSLGTGRTDDQAQPAAFRHPWDFGLPSGFATFTGIRLRHALPLAVSLPSRSPAGVAPCHPDLERLRPARHDRADADGRGQCTRRAAGGSVFASASSVPPNGLYPAAQFPLFATLLERCPSRHQEACEIPATDARSTPPRSTCRARTDQVSASASTSVSRISNDVAIQRFPRT